MDPTLVGSLLDGFISVVEVAAKLQVQSDLFRARIAEDPTAQLGEHDYDIADYGLSKD